MEQEVHPSQLLSPNGENGIYSSCSEAFDEILSHLPEAGNPAPKAELDVLSDEEDDASAAKKEKPSSVKVEKVGKEEEVEAEEEEEEEDVSPELPVFIQDWKSAERFEVKKMTSWRSDSEMTKDKWKTINGDANAADDVNFPAAFHDVSTDSAVPRTVADVATSENLLSKDVHVFDRSKEVRDAVRTEIDSESASLQTEFSDQLHRSPGKPGLESNEEMDAALQQKQQQQQLLGDQQDTVFTVQFQVSASIVELPDDENSSDDDVTSKNGSEETTVLRDDHRSTSGETKSSPDDVISTIDDERRNLVTEQDFDDDGGDLEKTYVYEIFQPLQTSDDPSGSPSRSNGSHLTRVMMRIRDREIDGCIERRTLNEETPHTYPKELKEEKTSTSDLQSRADEAKEEEQKTPEVEERNESMELKNKFHADETALPQRSPTKEVPAERPSSVDKAKGRFGEEHATKTKRAAVSIDLTTKVPSTSSEHVVESTKKSRTPSSSSLLVIKGESTKCVREDELPAPNSTKALLAKFKSLERENSVQRLDKDKHPRPTRSSNMTLSTSSLSGSFDRHSHSSGKQLAGRHQATAGAESTYPLATRSPSESVCSSDWDTESFGSDILQQHLLQSTQHLTSKEGEEESVLLTKSLLAQWKLLEEHERRLKQLEKSEKGLTASDAKIRSRSLGRLQSSIEKRISLLETPDGHHPFESDVLDASASLSKSLTLPKTSKPSLMRNESPASLKDQMFLPSCTMSDSSESLQQAKTKDFQQYLPPPFMTRYVLAKFKEMEALPQISQSPSTESTKKTFKWEVKEANPIGTYRGTTVEFRYRKPGSYDPFYRRSYSEEPRRIHFEMKAQDVISEEGQPSNDVTPGKEKSTKRKECPDGGQSDLKSEIDRETALKEDSNLESKKDIASKKAENLAEAKQYILKSYLDKHEPKEQPKKVVKSLLNYFNSLDEDREKKSEKVLSGKK